MAPLHVRLPAPSPGPATGRRPSRARGLGPAARLARPSSADELLSAVCNLYDHLPARHRTVARYLEAHRALIAVTEAQEIAAACRVAPATISRFAQRLGFAGYADLQALFRTGVGSCEAPSTMPSGRRHGTAAVARSATGAGATVRRVLLAGQGALERFALRLPDEQLGDALTLLRGADRVYVAGAGPCLIAATYLADLLSFTSKHAHLVAGGLGGSSAAQLRAIGPGDLLVAVSSVPYDRETVDCVRTAEARGARVLGITDSGLAPLARAAGLASLTAAATAPRSLTLTMALCQALVAALRVAEGSPKAGPEGDEPDATA